MHEIKVGDIILGKVTDVRPYAIFMSFDDGNKQGMLHISEISGTYIRDIDKFGSVGDEMKVKVIMIDESNGFLRVSLKQVPEKEMYSTHKNAPRHKIEADSDEFEPLVKRLPGWIRTTLKKAKGENND